MLFQYQVGGDRGRGWIKSDGNETETSNEWLSRTGSTLVTLLVFTPVTSVDFKYTKDSILQVDREDYGRCNVTSPISKFEDGSTVFKFDRSGFLYFSGKTGHCDAVEEMIVRIMVQSVRVRHSASPGECSFTVYRGTHQRRDCSASVLD
ncbi:hypothetical protein vseg_002712 [Gypsophila vaccaria]